MSQQTHFGERNTWGSGSSSAEILQSEWTYRHHAGHSLVVVYDRELDVSGKADTQVGECQSRRSWGMD